MRTASSPKGWRSGPLDEPQGLDAVERHGRRAAPHEPAADAQALAVGLDLEAAVDHQRARDRHEPRGHHEQRHGQGDLARVSGGAVEEAAGVVGVHRVLRDDADGAQHGDEHPDLRRGERPDQRVAGPQPPGRLAASLRRVAQRRAQARRLGLVDRAQRHLGLGPPGDLHLQLDDAEEPLDRAADRVDGADPRDGHDRLVGREHAAAKAQRRAVDGVGRGLPAHVADDGADHHADGTEHEGRAGTAAAGAEHQADEEGHEQPA
jgi:hypothetical protein